LLDHLPPNNHEPPPPAAVDDPVARPCHAGAAAVPGDGRASYAARTRSVDLVDDGAFLELRARFGTSVVTGLARIGGMPVGVVANHPTHPACAPDLERS